MLKFGCLLDEDDRRDYTIDVSNHVAAVPVEVDHSALLQPIGNQLNTCACTAFATTGAYLFDANEWFLYYNARNYMHMTKVDGGASIRNTLKAAKAKGACEQSLYEMSISNIPSKFAIKDGKKHRIKQYHKLRSLDAMIATLALGKLFIFEFRVFSAFMQTDGNVNMPAEPEKYLGRHAACSVGFNTETKRFKCRNSWGTAWGNKGYFTLPFDYLTTARLSSVQWSITV